MPLKDTCSIFTLCLIKQVDKCCYVKKRLDIKYKSTVRSTVQDASVCGIVLYVSTSTRVHKKTEGQKCQVGTQYNIRKNT